MFNARQATADAYIVVGVPPKAGEGNKSGYYLKTREQPAKPAEPVQTGQPADFKFESEEKIITGEEAKLLNKLLPFSPHHIVTYKELLKEAGTDDPQVLHQHLEQVRKLANVRKLRLAYVPNPRDPRNVGYYIEAIRKPKVKITILGDVVEHGNMRVRLPEEQYRLMWSLAAHREDPAFDTFLSERAFNEPDPEASSLNQVATALNEQLTQLTGAEGVVIPGGNEQFGLWHKLKDTRVVRKQGFLPVHSTRLNTLRLIFQDAPKQEIIKALGVTRGRKKASHGLTDPQALMALNRAVTRLTNRVNESITSDTETYTYREMVGYMAKNNLGDNKTLMAHIAQKLGAQYSSESLTEGFETQEIRHIDEGISSVNSPEFATLSRADINTIAAAINMHRRILEPILKKSGIRLVEQPVLRELLDLRGDEPIADFSKITKKGRDQFVHEFRIKALQKARELIESPDFEQTADQIYTQNPNVWCLLVNLSEMNKVRVANGTGVKQGMNFLTDLVADPESRKRGFFVIEETKPFSPAPISGQIEVPQLRSGSVILFDASTRTISHETPLPEGVIMAVEDETTAAQTPATQTKTTAPPLPATPRVPEPEAKPKIIETRDPDIRTRVNQFLDQISEHPELLQSASPGMVTRAFPRLKENVIDSAVEARLISTSQGKKENRENFNPVAIASLLYLYEFGDNLPRQLKKQIQRITAEEFKKRQTQ